MEKIKDILLIVGGVWVMVALSFAFYYAGKSDEMKYSAQCVGNGGQFINNVCTK